MLPTNGPEKLVQLQKVDGQWTGFMDSQDDRRNPITQSDINKLYRVLRYEYRRYRTSVRHKIAQEKRNVPVSDAANVPAPVASTEVGNGLPARAQRRVAVTGIVATGEADKLAARAAVAAAAAERSVREAL